MADAGPNARMLELDDPHLDWVHLPKGMGVEGVRVDTVAAFRSAFEAALRQTGPFLIEAVTRATDAPSGPVLGRYDALDDKPSGLRYRRHGAGRGLAWP